MKVTIEKHQGLSDVEVLIKCSEENEEVRRVVDVLQFVDQTLIGRKNGESHPLKPEAILYFESVDDRVYAYTDSDVYEVRQRLYEIERLLGVTAFVRVSISQIVNIKAITNFRTSINGRMEAKLKNAETIVISRNYVPMLKQALGGR